MLPATLPKLRNGKRGRRRIGHVGTLVKEKLQQLVPYRFCGLAFEKHLDERIEIADPDRRIADARVEAVRENGLEIVLVLAMSALLRMRRRGPSDR